MGSKVNPLLISSINRLEAAIDRLKSLKNQKNSMEYKNAEIAWRNAEKQYCNQPGLVEDNSPNALTKDEALKEVDKLVNKVASWYV